MVATWYSFDPHKPARWRRRLSCGGSQYGSTPSVSPGADQVVGAGAVLFVADHQGGELVGMTPNLVGLGGRLLDVVLHHGRQEGCGRVSLLTARANERARRPFGSRGFRATGRTSPGELGASMDDFEAHLR
jgi:hypothetical protein